jgi:DNA ligase (NAD+)
MITKNPPERFEDVDCISRKEAKREIYALREKINYHDYPYYTKNRPEISDALYDELFKRLEDLEDAFPEFQSERSLTRRVGAEPVDKLNKVNYTAPLLSCGT